MLVPAPAWSILDHACLSCHQRRFNPRTHRMRMAWALALCLPGVISAWLAPAAPPARFIHQRRVAALAFAPRMSAGPGEERQSGAKKLSPLIASLVESLVEKPRPTVRQPLSASDMVQLSVDAKAAASPESLAGQRRNFLLAVASPIVGAAAFASSRSRVGDPSPTDPLAILQAMERKSPTIQAALQSTRPTLVEFYGRNCPNCRAMAPDMNKLENQFHDRVNFVVLDAEKPEYASIVNLFKVDAIPHMAFISADRQLLTTLAGYIPGTEMEKQLTAFASGKLAFCGMDECKGGTAMLRSRQKFYSDTGLEF